MTSPFLHNWKQVQVTAAVFLSFGFWCIQDAWGSPEHWPKRGFSKLSFKDLNRTFVSCFRILYFTYELVRYTLGRFQPDTEAMCSIEKKTCLEQQWGFDERYFKQSCKAGNESRGKMNTGQRVFGKDSNQPLFFVMNGCKVDYRYSCIVTICRRVKENSMWCLANVERKTKTTCNAGKNNEQRLLENLYLKCISSEEMWDLLSLPKPWGLQRCLLLWLHPLLSRSSSPKPAPPSESHYPVYRSRTLQQATDRKHKGKLWIFKTLPLRLNEIGNKTRDNGKIK